MSNVVKLPTASTSFFTVQKRGAFFEVVLVTPMPKKNLKTWICSYSDRDTAIAVGKKLASQRERPFKLRGVAV